ncbi:hypothetical protein Ccrd_014980 [Cynara cardunculus var. scolymus]|uniref:Uncharacterized protein n=1 Tax=Cynara cardunculus var. scolymus TaxID=59895 RepID=A0A103YCP3_CYNCS|nr:hypothetical protein Ccrd_014980 [Cynara cardunculus var. scolymus]
MHMRRLPPQVPTQAQTQDMGFFFYKLFLRTTPDNDVGYGQGEVGFEMVDAIAIAIAIAKAEGAVFSFKAFFGKGLLFDLLLFSFRIQFDGWVQSYLLHYKTFCSF